MAFVNRGSLTASVTVSLSPDLSGNFVCSGAADDVEIDAALAYVAALGGGDVKLLQGTYVVASSININGSYCTLIGCGAGTVITGTINVDYIRVAQALTGVMVADLRIDGTDQTVGTGIYFVGASGNEITQSWVLHCTVENCFSRGIYLNYTNRCFVIGNTSNSQFDAIVLGNADNCTVSGNTCTGNTGDGISLFPTSLYNTIVGNTCSEQENDGIYVTNATGNTIAGNTCCSNAWSGIYFYDIANLNVVSGNACYKNGRHGIHLASADKNLIIGNICCENSQATNNLYDGIFLEDGSDYNSIIGNFIRAVPPGNVIRYGINISEADCDGNLVVDNDLYDDGYGTAPFNDGGTDTRLPAKIFQFIAGGDEATGIVLANFLHGTAVAKGWEIDAATEFAIALGQLPTNIHQVVRIKIWAVGLAAPGAGNQMELEVVFNAGASAEAFNLAANSWTHANLLSNEIGSAINDVISWTIDATVEAEVANLLGGDNFELKVIHEAAVPDDVETDAVFRIIEVEYV